MNKKIFITGAFGGIGKEILKEYINNNYFCYCVTSKKNDHIKTLEKKFLNKIKILYLDFNTENWLKILENEKRKIGKVDAIINCAGINIIKNISNVSYVDFVKINKINYESFYFVIKCLLGNLSKSKEPRIVNISSIWSEISKPKRSLYSGTKGAINSLTRALALEFGSKKILINSISPGFVKTKLTKESLSKKEISQLSKLIPLKRFAKPEEIAKLVYFLGSEKNTYITGQNILCDGGFSIQ